MTKHDLLEGRALARRRPDQCQLFPVRATEEADGVLPSQFSCTNRRVLSLCELYGRIKNDPAMTEDNEAIAHLLYVSDDV